MKKYNPRKIEKEVQKKWEENKVYFHRNQKDKPKYYVLDMFPYPSGDGLHMGHTESYTASDIVYRYKRLQGFDVLHPQGFDSFGLPAENYAVKTGIHPKETTKKNTENYIRQMKMLGLGHDLDHLIYTSDPSYYKWTQWLFGKFFENGLVERKTDKINWCPSCNTGIANEQVENGKCERCKTEIEQKEVPGWFFKITDFAEDLINDLDKVDWPEATKKNQINWIGRSEGAKISFKIKKSSQTNANLTRTNTEGCEILNDENEKSNVILVHGCPSDKEKAMDLKTRTYDKHWQPWIKKELEKRGVKVDLPLMPHPWAPVYEKHKKEFEKLNINENSVLVGHSCGANFLVRWLSETGQKIKKLILVAPWNEPNHKIKEKAKFYDISKVDYSFKNNISDGVTIFTSDNEEKIGKDTAKMWTDKLNAKLIELKNHWHYTEGGMGTTKFPELLKEIIGKQKPNVILMHGKNAHPQEKWYPWLAEEMNKRGVKFTAPKLPDADDPNIESWKKELSKTQPNENSILIGHSRGGVAILRWLEEQSKDFKVKKVILVATNSGDSARRNKTENNKGFFSKEGYDFEKIKQHCDDFTVLHSEDDEWVPFSAGQENAKGLNAKFLQFKDRGHFGSKLPEQKIPELLEEILSEIESSPRESASSLRNSTTSTEVEVFTTRPDTLFGATYLVLAPEHPLIEKLKSEIKNWSEVKDYVERAKNKTEMERLESKEKTGVKLEGLVAINPAIAKMLSQLQTDADTASQSQKYAEKRNRTDAEKDILRGSALSLRESAVSPEAEIPIFVADYVLGGYGTGAIMAVPAHDERDYAFASQMNAERTQKYAEGTRTDAGKIEIRQVIDCGDLPCSEKGKLINSGQFDGMDSEEAKKAITEFVGGEMTINYRLRDWSISRQRYWGCPIPIVYNKIEKEKIKQQAFQINFYDQKIWKQLISGIKTVETRALNPKKTNRYFGNIKKGNYIKAVNKKTGQEKYFQVRNVWKFKNLKELWETRKELLTDIFPEKEFTNFRELEKKYKFTSDYLERINRNGLVAWRLKVIEPGVKFVGEENLPWLLPEDVDFKPTGTAPLAKSKELKERTEKLFGKGWTPEVDTMDTFVDSSWYFLRYPDPENEKEFCSREKLKRWLPVDLYIGGAEHTYMHLLYARFFVKAMRKMGLVSFNEPFLKLRHQGMVLDKNGVKMSKSKGNVVNPDDMVKQFGADATRIYMMFAGPLEEDVMWKEEGVKGVYNFLQKIWRIFQEKNLIDCQEGKSSEIDKKLPFILHKTIKGVTEDIEGLKFNTAISKLMIFINEFAKHQNLPKKAMEIFLILFSPFAPHLSQYLWEQLGKKDFILDQKWPQYDSKFTQEETIELVIQINGKVRDKIKVSAGISEKEAKEKALASEKIKKYTEGKKIKKTIFVPGRLINLVI